MTAGPLDTGRAATTTRRLGWVIAWAISLALTFVLGYQMGPGPETTSSPAPGATTSTDPEIVDLLHRLPRRQADDPLALGAAQAPVVLTEWSDFRCPYCARWATQTLPELQSYVDEGTLRIEHRDLAILGEQSITTAVAARGAGRQGRFWDYHAAVFAAGDDVAGPDHNQAALMDFARTAGVPDLPAFEAALTDPALRQAVERDTAEAQQLGITGTPFFVINTTVIRGIRPTAEFITAIESHAED